MIARHPAPPGCERWSYDTCFECVIALGGQRLSGAGDRRSCPAMRAGTAIHASITGRVRASEACFASLEAVQVILESPNGEAPRRLALSSDGPSDIAEDTLEVAMEVPGHELRAVAVALRLTPTAEGCEAIFEPGATLRIAAHPGPTHR